MTEVVEHKRKRMDTMPEHFEEETEGSKNPRVRTIQERLQVEEDRLRRLQQLSESKERVSATRREVDVLRGTYKDVQQKPEWSEQRQIRRQIIEKVKIFNTILILQQER
jgi:hypothetical protein